MIVCYCLKLTCRDIKKAIHEGSRTLEAIERTCKAGKGCGSCKPAIQEILTEMTTTEENLDVAQTAKLLGVTSYLTIYNWLKGGHFPGSFTTPEGHWRFPKHEVLAMKDHMLEIRRRNEANDMTPPELEDE